MRKLTLMGAMVSGIALCAAAPAYAQQAKPTTTSGQAPGDDVIPDDAGEDIIIVTGTAGGSALRKQDASFAITTVSADALETAAPKSTAEIFTLVPGVSAESSGGKSGANIFVRGLPASGDAPFVTIALGGAPIYGTPTLSFLEQSTMFRADQTIASVEALRGGPNAVFGRGEPGVTMNFRLREGSDVMEGLGKVSLTDFGEVQVDGVLSGPIADDLYFMVGGYWSQSDGIRDARFATEKGKQITGHVTYTPEWGKIGVYTRWTDDVGQWYLPMGLNSGNDLGTFSQLGPLTRYRTLQVGPNGETQEFDFARGRGWKGSVSGLNAEIFLSDSLTLRDNMAYTAGDADTYGLVPDGRAVQVADLANPNVSTASGIRLGGEQYIQNYGHWVVEKDLKSFANDLSLAWDTNNNTLTIGYYRSEFSSDDFWTLGNFTPVHNVANGDFLDPSVSCSDLQAAGSGSVCWAYGIRSTGDATVNALYLADSFEVTDKLRIDAGIRREWLKLDYTVDAGPGYPDGTIDTDKVVKESEWAYTGALNYAFSDDFGMFLRYSDGFTMPMFDNIRENNRSVNSIKQLEIGAKYSNDWLGLFLTGFRNELDAFRGDFTGNIRPTRFTTRSTGVEVDANIRSGGFNLGVLATYQDAKIIDSDNPVVIGNEVARQPAFQYRISPSYEFDLGASTLTFYGALANVGKRWGEIENINRLDSYTKVDAGIRVQNEGGMFGQFHIDNLTDSHGLTESDPRSLTNANGRPILGRSIRVSMGYEF